MYLWKFNKIGLTKLIQDHLYPLALKLIENEIYTFLSTCGNHVCYVFYGWSNFYNERWKLLARYLQWLLSIYQSPCHRIFTNCRCNVAFWVELRKKTKKIFNLFELKKIFFRKLLIRGIKWMNEVQWMVQPPTSGLLALVYKVIG